MDQMSFVNAIATTKGGKHVDAITDQLVKSILAQVTKKKEYKSVKPAAVKAFLHVFVNCLITNPTFDSQTKEHMIRAKKDFGSSYTLKAPFVKEVLKCGIIDHINTFAHNKAQSKLAKSCSGSKRSRLSGIPKLDDANEAGGRNSAKCTLILTEGYAHAMYGLRLFTSRIVTLRRLWPSLALALLVVIGSVCFPFGVNSSTCEMHLSTPCRRTLRSKLLCRSWYVDNVNWTSTDNDVIQGLKFGKKYESVKELRYGRLMIMTDQDQDGSHIKGLLINFIHHFWPSLLKVIVLIVLSHALTFGIAAAWISY